MKFKGFALVKLVRATTTKSPNAKVEEYTYEFVYHPSVGSVEHGFCKDSTRRSRFDKSIKMRNNCNHGILTNGKWTMIDEATYNTKLQEWEAA